MTIISPEKLKEKFYNKMYENFNLLIGEKDYFINRVAFEEGLRERAIPYLVTPNKYLHRYWILNDVTSIIDNQVCIQFWNNASLIEDALIKNTKFKDYSFVHFLGVVSRSEPYITSLGLRFGANIDNELNIKIFKHETKRKIVNKDLVSKSSKKNLLFNYKLISSFLV